MKFSEKFWGKGSPRGPLDRREDRERQHVHVDVLDQLFGGVGLEEPVQVQRAGRVGTGLARESGLNGDVRTQGVWRTGREYPRTRSMVSGTPSPWPKTAMKHRRSSDAPPGSSRATSRRTRAQDRRAKSGSIRATETTAGPVIRHSLRRAPDRARGRGGRHPRGGRPAGRCGLRSPSNAEYHAPAAAARSGRPGALGRCWRR